MDGILQLGHALITEDHEWYLLVCAEVIQDCKAIWLEHFTIVLIALFLWQRGKVGMEV